MAVSKDKDPNINKKPIMKWDDLDTFLRIDGQNKNKYITEIYKNYYMYPSDRSAELKMDGEEWRSNIKSPMTNMFVSRLYNKELGAEQNFTASYIGNKLTDELAQTAVDNILDWMDYCWTKSDTQDSFESGILDACATGRGVVKVGYRYSKYERPYLLKEGTGTKKMQVNEDYPDIQYISPYNFFIDPGAKSISGARFVAERKLLSDTQINEQYRIYGISIGAKMAKILDNKESSWIDSVDYEARKKNMPYYNTSIDRVIQDDDRYNIQKRTREVIELHTKDRVEIFINGESFGDFAQIGPYKAYKYKVIKFKKNPGTIYALGAGYIVKPLQEIYDKVLNLRIDNVVLTVNKTFLMENGLNIMGNSRRMKLRPGMIHKVARLDGIQELPVSEVKQSAYQETDMLMSLAQGATGVSNYALGVQNKVERVAGATDMLQDSLDSQIKPLLDSISDVMAEVMKEFVILSLTYTDKKEFDRVLGVDNVLKDLDINDLVQDYEFNYKLNSPKNKYDSTQRQQLLDLLRLTPQLVDAVGRPVIDIRAIAEKIWASFDGDMDQILTEEEYQELVAGNMEFQKQMQQMQQTPPPQPGGGDAGPEGVQALRRNQGLGGGGVPAEATTNAGGVNG